MSIGKPLKQTPIHEALIDIRCVVPDGFSAVTLATAAGSISKCLGLSVHEVRKVKDTKIELDSRTANLTVESGEEVVDRVLLKNEQGDRIVQLWADGITASQLQPYGGWDSLESLAEQAFAAWSQVAFPIDIKRLAARFINRIRFEGKTVDLDKLFTCAPQVPVGLPDDLFYFTSRLGIHDKSKDLIAWVLLEAAPHLAKEDTGVILLDIDVVKERRFGTSEFSALRQHLAAIRETKNAAFFSAISDEKMKDYQ